MRIWRLCKRRHAALDGEGARRSGGRWNSSGVSVVYASATLSLAALELLVHLDPEDTPDDLVAIPLDVPEDVRVEGFALRDLTGDWRQTPAPRALQQLGDSWVRRGETAILSLPSVVVPAESNFALNPAHPDFGPIKPGRPESFRFDPRLRRR